MKGCPGMKITAFNSNIPEVGTLRPGVYSLMSRETPGQALAQLIHRSQVTLVSLELCLPEIQDVEIERERQMMLH